MDTVIKTEETYFDRWATIDSKAKEHRLVELFRLLEQHSIEAVLLKGWAISRFYPPDCPRAYTDIDIAVPPGEYDRVRSMLKGARINFEVDVHDGLRQLDTGRWDEIIANSESFDVQGTEIRVLSCEDNLRVTAVHWLTDGGMFRERLWDIYYLVTNRPNGFDWAKCLNDNGPVRKTWVIAAILSAAEFLGLEIADLPDEVKRGKLPDWFRKTLGHEWKLGVYARVPLRICLTSPKLFFQQLRRRLPPNKIAATVEMEEPIDSRGRSSIQIRSTAKRTVSFLRHVSKRSLILAV